MDKNEEVKQDKLIVQYKCSLHAKSGATDILQERCRECLEGNTSAMREEIKEVDRTEGRR